MSKHASRRQRTKGGRRKKHHNRPSLSAAARKARKTRADAARQRPVAEAELDRLGKYAIDEARLENEKRYQRRLVGSSDGRLYLLRLTDGELLWSYQIGQPIVSSPAVAGGVVIIGSEDGYLYAFAPDH